MNASDYLAMRSLIIGEIRHSLTAARTAARHRRRGVQLFNEGRALGLNEALAMILPRDLDDEAKPASAPTTGAPDTEMDGRQPGTATEGE